MTAMTEEPREKRHVAMVIAYDGRAYHGWQRQAAGIDTVQERFERAAVVVLRHPVGTRGASRTDAGVHAAGQVVCLRTGNRSIPLAGMRRAINARLPGDIAVRSAREAPPDFDPSLDATGKTYRYLLSVSPRKPLAAAGNVWHYGRPLVVEPMRRAARQLVGRNDFAGFASKGDDRESTVRRIFSCDVVERGCLLGVTVRGDGFLYRMVRNIVGTLLEIGRGRWGPERIDAILAAADRALAGPTAPAEGLTLLRVHYERR